MRVCVKTSLYLALSVAAFGQQKTTPGSTPSTRIEHGKYIAENVAMCVQCHSPREATGELVRSKLFEGAPIPVDKPSQLSVWADYAPRIAGLPQYTEDQMVKLLTTGIGREGKPLRAPMPTFKMTLQDAADVVTYLKLIK